MGGVDLHATPGDSKRVGELLAGASADRHFGDADGSAAVYSGEFGGDRE